MSSPESADLGCFAGYEVPPDYPQLELTAIEGRERLHAFGELHEEIARLELLGIDHLPRQSYHETSAGGSERLVFIMHAIEKHLGRHARVIVNDKDLAKQEGSPIVVRDFCVARRRNDLTLVETATTHDHVHLPVITDDTGPILFMRSDYIKIVQGKNYTRSYPYENRPTKYIDVLDRRIVAQALVEILKPLNHKDTLKPGVRVQKPSNSG